MNKLSTLLKKVDDSILSFLLTFFLFFIPLFPKIPFKTIEYTYVAIRPDDIFVALIALVFIVQLIRKKVVLNKSLLVPFLLFWASVFVSYFIAVFITDKIVYRQVGLLHSLRRIEYMMIFFIASSQIRRVSDFTRYLFAISASSFLVMVYGIGQRIAEFPSISTMNPEFARGRVLFLTPEARIASTFAGHYDLAAYLVFFTPIIWGMYFLHHKKLLTLAEKIFEKTTIITSKLSSLIDGTMGLVLSKFKPKSLFTDTLSTLREDFELKTMNVKLVASACLLAVSLFAISIKTYELAIGSTLFVTLAIYLYMYKKHKGMALVSLLALMLFVLVQTASRSSFFAYLASTSLYLLFIRKYRYLLVVFILSAFLTYQNKNLSERFSSTFQVRQFLVNEKTGEIFVLQKMRTDELPAGSRVLVKIDNKKKNTRDEAAVKKEFLNNATIAAKTKPSNIASNSAASDYRQVQGIAPDISFDTRLRVEWPRAINAFMSNPLFGTGPSSITESTDNDFLRWLGELGLVGTVIFLYILTIIASQVYSMAKTANNESKPIFYGFLFGLFGLLINALYIDVFEASKVAYMFWATSGIFCGLFLIKKNEDPK